MSLRVDSNQSLTGGQTSPLRTFIYTSRSGATLRAGTARPTCALCNKAMPVKRKLIYILNIVVKQEILIKTGKQNRRHIVVLHATEFHSLQKYQSHDKTSFYTTLTV